MNSPSQSSFTSASTLQCSYCGKCFGRTEHLKRHSLIHTKDNSFSCALCSKQFTRRDALQRHELTHRTEGPTLLRTGGRACSNCRSSKSRCSGERTCERCQNRGLNCTYPAKVRTQTGQGESDSDPRAARREDDQPRNSFHFGDEVLGNGTADYPAPLSVSNSASSFWPSMINWLDPDIQDCGNFQDLFPAETEEHIAASIGFLDSGILQTGNSNGIHSTPISSTCDSGLSVLSPLSTQSQTSPIVVENSPSEFGSFYVDGGAARLPRVKRRRTRLESTSTRSAPGIFRFSLRLLAPIPLLEHSPSSSWVVENTLPQIREVYERHCLYCSEMKARFEDVEIPSLASLAHLLDLYFKNFNYILPIFHASSSFQEPLHWQLSLAMLAVGSAFLETEQSGIFAESMREFARRAIGDKEQTNELPDVDKVTRIQINMLQTISNSYCEQPGNKRLRIELMWDILDCLQFDVTNITPFRQGSVPSKEEIELKWKDWRQKESLQRTWYAAWLLDCMWVFQFEDRPIFTLQDAARPLPSNEKLWSAETAREWYELQSKYPPTPTLLEALEKMYVEKHVPQELGEFSRQLILHGLFRRSWEVEAYLRQRLSHWTPTAKKQPSADVLPKAPIWLPAIQTFTRWRNSACDCIDILHWDANAKIGAASGFEHPTVLHLHLSRVILLTPFREIRRLAQSLAGEALVSTPDQIRLDRNIISRWSTQDQFKARLGVIHAGVLLWHVRRHSANAFYEPSAVFLATLALWAFSAFTPHLASIEPSTADNGGEVDVMRNRPSAEINAPVAGIILLDRPTDDELVQKFICEGSTMLAYISGAGNLLSQGAALRVLGVGEELLDSLTCWSIAKRKKGFLQKLKEAWKRKMEHED